MTGTQGMSFAILSVHGDVLATVTADEIAEARALRQTVTAETETPLPVVGRDLLGRQKRRLRRERDQRAANLTQRERDLQTTLSLLLRRLYDL